MKDRCEVLRFADGMFTLMQQHYPDFKGFRYDYNASAFLMAVIALAQLERITFDSQGQPQAQVPMELMDSFFRLDECDFYDYHVFIELENKCSYTRKNGEAVKLPLILNLQPKGNMLLCTLNPDFYKLLGQTDACQDGNNEMFQKCLAKLS